MVRRAKAVVVGALVLVVASACGDDNTKPQPANSAGSGADAGQPGTSDGPDAGAAGTSAGGRGAQVGAGGAAGAAGAAPEQSEGGAPIAANADVNGQVLAGHLPLAGAVVVVNGVVKVVDAEGRFRVRNVAAQYQLMIRYPGTHLVFVYAGLKTREPLATFPRAVTSVPRSATVRGKLLEGWSDPGPDDSSKAVVYFGQHAGSSGQDALDPIDGFEVQPQWDGDDTSDDGELWALQYLSDFDRGAYEYAGFGRRKISVTDQSILGSADGDAASDITLVDPPELTLETHTDLPPGWALDFFSTLYVGPLWAQLTVSDGDGSIVVPKLDAPVLVETSASLDGASTLVESPVPQQGATLDIVHPAPPNLTSPDADATGITPSTEFFWEGAPENSVANLTFRVGDWAVFVSTGESSFKFPDLTPLHVRVPAQISGKWSVSVVGPAATVEESMVRDAQTSDGSKIAGFMSTSAERDFVTGP